MKDFLQVIKVINQMQAAGVIGKYAIGGAIGASFYPVEPTVTFDIDVFIPFKNISGGSIVSLEHVYNYLKPLGYKPKDEHVIIEGWLVQFLPADDELHNEALLQAVERNVGGVKTQITYPGLPTHTVETDVDGVKTWVMTAEHLMAIALKTGRGKDLTRIEQFVTNKAFDANKLNQILARNGLLAKWEQLNYKCIEGNK